MNTWTRDDTDAVRQLMPPRADETWDRYCTRAQQDGIMTFGDVMCLMDAYGMSAMRKKVQPLEG
jgi:hypothetical protein